MDFRSNISYLLCFAVLLLRIVEYVLACVRMVDSKWRYAIPKLQVVYRLIVMLEVFVWLIQLLDLVTIYQIEGNTVYCYCAM